MTIVQLAVLDTRFTQSLQELLLNDGKHDVLVVDSPDVTLPGLIVAEVGLLAQLSSLAMPERFVVVARPGDDLFMLWRAGIRNVVFAHTPAKTVYFGNSVGRTETFCRDAPERDVTCFDTGRRHRETTQSFRSLHP